MVYKSFFDIFVLKLQDTMKMYFKYSALFFYLLLAGKLYGQSDSNLRYGLMFNSYEVEKDLRTSLNLTPEKALSLPDNYSLSFYLQLKDAYHLFGYIFRIVGTNNQHIDFLLSRPDGSSQYPYLTFVDTSGKNLFSFPMRKTGINFEEWIFVKISLDIKNNFVEVDINNNTNTAQHLNLKDFRKVNIAFGKNNYPLFQTSDIVSMSVRDIKIENNKNKLLYYWKLSRHSGNNVYDEVKQHKAVCENPNWLMSQHAFWNKQITFSTGKNPQICYNQDIGELAVIDKTHFYNYSFSSKKLSIEEFSSGVPLGNYSNQLYYNPVEKYYFTYNFIDHIAEYDMGIKAWDNNLPDTEEPSFWHHNRFFSPTTNKFYTFGGYGFHTYHNDIQTYSFAEKKWEKNKVKVDRPISPRYLSGLGIINDNTSLLFGGYGSETGNQELAPKNFYDLFKINFDTFEAEYVWSLNPAEHNFAVANSMIVDSISGCFYALCYSHQKFSTHLSLCKFSLENPHYEILADRIPYFFDDTKSYADLYYNKQENEFIAVTSYMLPSDTVSKISVYTLSAPPLPINSLVQKEQGSHVWLFLSLLLSLIIAIICTFYILIKKKSGNRTPELQQNDSNVLDNYKIVEKIEPAKNTIKKQAIILLGGFQVLDKNSKNITGEFTPILKQLFLLILLNTLKDGKGISSIKLKDTLWFDKTEESARNNRGVFLSKLRVILEQVGEISINNQNSYWTIRIKEDIYCDYSEILQLANSLKNPETRNPDDIRKLLSIALTGELVPNMQTEWVDAFKSDFSNLIIDLLLSILEQYEKEMSSQMKLSLADAIFVHDSLNEDALRLKCSVLKKLGKNKLAKNIYDSFTKEYKLLFGSDYKYSFEDIIN